MAKKNSVDPVRPLTPAEQTLVDRINKTWTRERALSELTSHLQVAIEIELATLPIYLYTYYSIDRTPKGFPDTELSRFADKAGSVIMSVAVEEMLHMSLSSNVLFSLGKLPQLYLNSPGPFPTNLPGHTKLGPDKKPLALPLAKFSEEQLWKFLEIEYPAASDAPPEGGNWETIGQIYSYVRCIICSNHITDDDFKQGAKLHQIQPSNYSPNSIDTVFPTGSFNYKAPVAPPVKGSAASVASFSSREDSHAGRFELITVDSKQSALQAIQTIDAQGEGFGPSKFDDPSHQEYSHYFKFLTLQSQLQGYSEKSENLPAAPKPPAPSKTPISTNELSKIVFNFPVNPVASAYPSGRRDVANLVSALYQYMLIMTESIFLQPPEKQKLYFNQSLHRSMIWILDKIIQNMRVVNLDDTSDTTESVRLAPTFENIHLGTRDQAFSTLQAMCNDLNERYGTASWYTAGLQYYVNLIPTLPDVSSLWQTTNIKAPSVAKYQGVPKFPANPPTKVGDNEVRHACMALNHCKGQGRTRDNACAGQGYCSTALEYNFANPSQPLVSDHTCHVKNACAGQGGCGLYGTAEEQNHPGANKCANLGSCATPINAERFSTDGPNRGKSVWLRARQVFAEQTWPKLREANPNLPQQPPQVPHPELFQYGPTIEWIATYSDEGMTACGSSGMSGAHSCA
ncbi:MAG TPA: ferritin-like domain-containing protein [Pseudomonadales bacterium]|nr:ferritin-like domain-containing protein [Pseudomonadales bacterium]